MSSPIYSTRDDLAALAWTIAVKGASQTETRLLVPHVRAMVDTAIRNLSLEVWASGADRQRLFKEFAVSLDASGQAPLDPTIIVESINPDMGGDVYSATMEAGGISGYLDYYADFASPTLAHGFEGIGGYVIKGGDGAAGKIFCFDDTGAAGSLASTSVTVRGAVHYSFATVPEYYKSRLVEVLVSMARAKMMGMTEPNPVQGQEGA